MERSNQPPKTEGCESEGGPPDLWFYRTKRPTRSVPRERREPQAGPASGLSNSASKDYNAGGDGVSSPVPNTDTTATGEGVAGLPGSESVARAEGGARNRGGPESSCRTNCEGQAGTAAQRQEAPTDEPGVGLAHSIQRQGASPEVGEGANKSTQPAQATSPVRTTENDWQTFLRAIAEKASKNKHHRFGDLYRWLNRDVLRLCFSRLRKDAASGVDGVSFQGYERDLESNLADLEGRLKRKAYRARLVRRKYIPKGQGKLRPLGIPALEDKLLQVAVTQVLLAIYEVEFLPCSYGYRRGVGAHDALYDLTQELQWGRHNYVTEADIKGFFDNIRWEWLERMLERRIADGAFLNLIRKWLRAGVLEEDGRVIHPLTGTPQGGIVSPVLANIYLHYAVDLWVCQWRKRRARGEADLTTPDFMRAVRGAAQSLKIDPEMLKRPLNVGFSGGEKKRMEVLQMALLRPRLGVLDETDSGLDIDALRIVAEGVNALRDPKRSFLVITHYQRLLEYIKPDVVHVMAKGRIVKSGGPELALELERNGYRDFSGEAA